MYRVEQDMENMYRVEHNFDIYKVEKDIKERYVSQTRSR